MPCYDRIYKIWYDGLVLRSFEENSQKSEKPEINVKDLDFFMCAKFKDTIFTIKMRLVPLNYLNFGVLVSNVFVCQVLKQTWHCTHCT